MRPGRAAVTHNTGTRKGGGAAFEKDTRPPLPPLTPPYPPLQKVGTRQCNTTKEPRELSQKRNQLCVGRSGRVRSSWAGIGSGRVGGTAREGPHATPRHSTSYHTMQRQAAKREHNKTPAPAPAASPRLLSQHYVVAMQSIQLVPVGKLSQKTNLRTNILGVIHRSGTTSILHASDGSPVPTA